MILLLLALGAVSDFDGALGQRMFDEAWTLAGESDSLRAEVLSAAGFDEAAVLLDALGWYGDPSPSRFLRIWSDFGTLEPSPLLRSLFREQLDGVYGMDWTGDELLTLWYLAFGLEDTTTAFAVEDRIFGEYPGSAAAAAVAGDLFYESLYPVWYDDSAKIGVLDVFIDTYGCRSDYWRSNAYQYLLPSVTSTADSSRWTEYLERWLGSCPGDPVACLSGASMYISTDSSWAGALPLAEEGLAGWAGWDPVGLDSAERAIEAPALRANLVFTEARCLDGLGRIGEADSVLAPLLDPDLFDLDDNHTASPYFWLAGEMSLESGDTAAAVEALILSASLGDVVDRWAGLSAARLESLAPEEAGWMDWCRERAGYRGPVFEDVTGMLGPDSQLLGTRVSWGDYDGDGYPDLLLGNRFYWNRRGTGFVDVTDLAGLGADRGNGGVFGDLDCDGDLDLITSGMPVQVFVQEDGCFTDATYDLGIFPTGLRVEGVGLLDWNADGWLDVYLASYEKPGTLGEGTPDLFYLGGPEGFREVSDSLGMVPFRGEHLCGRGVSPCDYDMDGDVDVFVSDYRLQENLLWSNDTCGASNTALVDGLAGHDTEGWWGHTIGSTWGDYDGDGDWDLFSANLAHPRYIGFSDRSELLENDGGVFRDRRADAGIRYEETHSNPLWADFDNDGWLDLYVTSIYEDRRSFLYLSNGDGTFTDVTFLSGSRVFDGWGAAAADFDRDGRLDLAVGSSSGPRLLRNVTGSEGQWLLVEIKAPEGVNGSATGCVLEIGDGTVTWLRQVEGGSGTTSQPEGTLHFGLPGPGPFEWRLRAPGGGVWSGTVVGTCRMITVP